MQPSVTAQDRCEKPERGDVVPQLTGRDLSGETISTRDFYMRRNLAIMFVDVDDVGHAWIAEAAERRPEAHAEAGEIIVVGPAGMDIRGLPTIVDSDGALGSRFGLSRRELPALFIVDRFGTLFASNRGDHAIEDLQPRDIPGWLEFIACRCS
jgi:hypothetical protein